MLPPLSLAFITTDFPPTSLLPLGLRTPLLGDRELLAILSGVLSVLHWDDMTSVVPFRGTAKLPVILGDMATLAVVLKEKVFATELLCTSMGDDTLWGNSSTLLLVDVTANIPGGVTDDVLDIVVVPEQAGTEHVAVL